MEHLVEHDVLDDEPRHARVIEDAADYDGVVGGVVVAEAVAGVGAAPGELWTSHQAVEETAVQVFEDFVEMVVVSGSGVDLFASSHLADEACFGGDVVATDVSAITGALGAVDGLAVEFGQEDVRDGMEYRAGRAFEQIGEARIEFSLAQADGVVNRDERIEPHVHRGNGRTRAQLSVGCMENFCQLRGHVESRVA